MKSKSAESATKYIIGGLIMLFLVYVFMNTSSEYERSTYTPEPRAQALGIVYIGGIENGECLVPKVNLWNKPGGIAASARVIDSVKGCVGLPVEVMERRNIPPRTWYHVRTYGANKGKAGWVSETLIIPTK